MQLLALLLLRIDKIAGADRDIFPLCQDAVSEVGKPGYPGGLITRRAVSTCKIAGGRKFKSTPRYCLFFQQDCSLCAYTYRIDSPYFCPLTSSAYHTSCTMGSIFHKQARA